MVVEKADSDGTAAEREDVHEGNHAEWQAMVGRGKTISIAYVSVVAGL